MADPAYGAVGQLPPNRTEVPQATGGQSQAIDYRQDNPGANWFHNGTSGTVPNTGGWNNPTPGSQLWLDYAAAAGAKQQMTPSQQDAWAIIQQYFQTLGISDSSASDWAKGLITSGATTDQVEVQMYDQSWFKQRFPEIDLAQKNGLPPISVQDVLNYEQTVSQLEQQVGLPQGFITKDDITKFMGQYNVSATELTDRLTQGYITAKQALDNVPEVAQALKDYYNVGPGGLAAYWLNPTKALATLQTQFTAAQIGGASALSGFGQVGQGTAQELAGFGITPTQATTGFQQLAHMAQAYNPIIGNPSGLTQLQQVAGQFMGSGPDQLAMQLSAESRQSAFQGGSDFTASNSGAQGLGAAVPTR